MIMADRYHRQVIRGKQLLRAEIVRRVFGSQTALAEILGVTQSTVNHIIFLRQSSERLDREITERIRAVDPGLVKPWALPDLPKGASLATLMRISAVIAGIVLLT